jgi:flagellin-like protein
MKIGKFKLNRRAVSPVIATLLMIAIAVAASIIVYVWSIGLLGGLMQSGGGAQTAEQLVMTAFDGHTKVTVQNTGARAINMSMLYVNGVATSAGLPVVLQPGSSTQLTLATDLATSFGGTSVVVKIVSRDGAVFVFTVIGGQPGMIAPAIYELQKLVA